MARIWRPSCGTAVPRGSGSVARHCPQPGVRKRSGSTRKDPTMPLRRCPCGSGLPLDECCGRLHDGSATAATAEQLMRSRYSAFARGDAAYLLATWHPATRPRTLTLDPSVRWTGLEILAGTGGALLAAEGTVEFRASYVADGT